MLPDSWKIGDVLIYKYSEDYVSNHLWIVISESRLSSIIKPDWIANINPLYTYERNVRSTGLTFLYKKYVQ